MAAPLTSDQIFNTLKSEFLIPLTSVAGRADYTSAGLAGNAATVGVANVMRNDWSSGQFTALAIFNGAAPPGTALAAAALAAGAAAAGATPPAPAAPWADYTQNDYQLVRHALGAGAGAGGGPIALNDRVARAAGAVANAIPAGPKTADQQKDAVRTTVIDADLRIPTGPGVAAVAGPVVTAANVRTALALTPAAAVADVARVELGAAFGAIPGGLQAAVDAEVTRAVTAINDAVAVAAIVDARPAADVTAAANAVEAAVAAAVADVIAGANSADVLARATAQVAAAAAVVAAVVAAGATSTNQASEAAIVALRTAINTVEAEFTNRGPPANPAAAAADLAAVVAVANAVGAAVTARNAQIAAVVAAVAAAAGPPAVAGAPSTALLDVMNTIFMGDWTLNPITKKAIFNVPKSDELLRRCVSVVFAKSSGVDIVPAGATVNDMANAMVATISGPFFNNMPKSDSDMYIALLGLNKEDRESLARYDERVDRIREALSQGPAPGAATGIQPGNIVPNPVLNSVSVFSAYPASLQEALRQRRKSDPSAANPAATLNRIRISMNGGAYNAGTNNLVGGNASRALPLYPRLVMNGGSHPLAVMEGGAGMAAWPGASNPASAAANAAATPPGTWPTSRANPNPVSLLDGRIKELESQFNRTTGQNLGALSGEIRGYSDSLNTAMDNLQKELQNLADANKALSQFSPGLGLDVSASSSLQLKQITDQADKINKDAAKASKQLDKLTQIKDSLEELVNKSNPAPRT